MSPTRSSAGSASSGAVVIAPVLVGIIGMVIETLFIRRLYREDPALTLLFTFGLAMATEQSLRLIWGATGLPFPMPEMFRGVLLIGDFIYSYYRLTMLGVAAAVVLGTWLLLNKTPFGMIVRAGTSDPEMVRALGISLRPVLTAIFGLGIALAGLAGVMSAPLAGVQPAMGIEILTAAFVVVVIGGLGSFWGVVVAGLLVGVVRGLTVFFYPAGGGGLDVRAHGAGPAAPAARPDGREGRPARMTALRILRHPLLVLAAALIVLPWFIQALGLPISIASEIALFALVGLGFNLLLGYTGLLSFGHGAFFGLAAYAAALFQIHLTPELVRAAPGVRGRARGARRAGHRLPRAAPARRVLLAAHLGVHRHDVLHRLSLDLVHRRRERPARDPAARRPGRRSRRSDAPSTS